jgi:C-terminal processing protease CtpA/Prc
VEGWDNNTINNRTICNQRVTGPHDTALEGGVTTLTCPSGAEIELRVAEAQPKLGIGLYYELTTYGVNVTRTLAESPARRAGLNRGDQIIRIQDKSVQDMEEGEAQSLINANAQLGVRLVVKHADGKEDQLELREAAVYPLVGEVKRPEWEK